MIQGINRETVEDMRERLLQDSEVREMISMRAYELYLGRNAEDGREIEDWLRAENEILTILIQEELRNLTTYPIPEPVPAEGARSAGKVRVTRGKPAMEAEKASTKGAKVAKKPASKKPAIAAKAPKAARKIGEKSKVDQAESAGSIEAAERLEDLEKPKPAARGSAKPKTEKKSDASRDKKAGSTNGVETKPAASKANK